MPMMPPPMGMMPAPNMHAGPGGVPMLSQGMMPPHPNFMNMVYGGAPYPIAGQEREDSESEGEEEDGEEELDHEHDQTKPTLVPEAKPAPGIEQKVEVTVPAEA